MPVFALYPEKKLPSFPFAVSDTDSGSEEPAISIRLINVRTDPF